MPKVRVTPEPSLRLQIKHGIALGPGKAELLKHIEATGSISEAAKLLKMSYRTAWQLVEAMNEHYVEPLVLTAKGGAVRGGSSLTPTGVEVLRLYVSMEARAIKAIKLDLAKLEKLLKQ